MCTGYGDSNMKVWSLTPNKLRSMKQLDELELIDKDAGRNFSINWVLNFSLYSMEHSLNKEKMFSFF